MFVYKQCLVDWLFLCTVKKGGKKKQTKHPQTKRENDDTHFKWSVDTHKRIEIINDVSYLKTLLFEFLRFIILPWRHNNLKMLKDDVWNCVEEALRYQVHL